MKNKVVGGLIVSALLVYLSVRGIHWEEVAAGFGTIRLVWLAPALFLMLLMQVLRSYRWGLILRPLAQIDQLTLFAVTCVGFMAISALPARLGELARPYLIARKGNLRMSSALGTIFVERVLDCLTVLIVAAATLLLIPLPPWLVRSGVLFLTVTLGIAAAMCLLIGKQEAALRILAPLLGRLPVRYAVRVRRLIGQFIDGFRILSDPALLISVTALSLLIWLLDVLIISLLFLAFGWQLPAAAAVVLMLVLIVGIAIPTAPGFIGNWHYFCVLGLSLFDVPKPEALTFAIVYHALSIGLLLLLGLAFLPFNRLSLSALNRKSVTNPP